MLLVLVTAAPAAGYAQSAGSGSAAASVTAAAADTIGPERDEFAPLTPGFDFSDVDPALKDSAAHVLGVDSVDVGADSTVTLYQGDGRLTVTPADTHMLRANRKHAHFLPDPQRALWLSFVFPGGGQIYNRKYWKLPIFYGGFLGCMYAFTWNQQMYMDYSQAYLDIMDDDPTTNSYNQMFPASYDIENNVSRYQTVFKNRKDRFRRWRDLSAFCFVAVYALSVIDAYVDAQLSDFDITPDLSLHVAPTGFDATPTSRGGIGLGAALTF